MSFKLPIAFVNAMRQNDTLLQLLGATKPTGATEYQGARIYTFARTIDEEKEDKKPYIVIETRGIESEGTKDDYEECDTSTVCLLCVADTRSSLINLCDLTRATIAEHLEDTSDIELYGYTFSAGAGNYDPENPAFWQELTYRCETKSIN